MEPMIDGERLDVEVSAQDVRTGAAKSMAGWTVTASWVNAAPGPLPEPECRALDGGRWGVTASTAGLGGYTAALRVTAYDPNTEDVMKRDFEVRVQK